MKNFPIGAAAAGNGAVDHAMILGCKTLDRTEQISANQEKRMLSNFSNVQAASSTSYRLPNNPKNIYFIDECLGGRIFLARLQQANIEVKVHKNHFAQGTRDVDWISWVSQQGWIIVTEDQKFDPEDPKYKL